MCVCERERTVEEVGLGDEDLMVQGALPSSGGTTPFMVYYPRVQGAPCTPGFRVCYPLPSGRRDPGMSGVTQGCSVGFWVITSDAALRSSAKLRSTSRRSGWAMIQRVCVVIRCDVCSNLECVCSNMCSILNRVRNKLE